MRLNKWLVLSRAVNSRRKADELIKAGEVTINDQTAKLGDIVGEADKVYLSNQRLSLAITEPQLVIFNKPRGLICSHRQQKKSRIIFDILPENLHHYTIIGRLDRESEGLVLLTNNGKLAHRLMHPSFNVERVYEVDVAEPIDDQLINHLMRGVSLKDGISRAKNAHRLSGHKLQITLTEGRNHQIRRTLAELNYQVTKLVRLQHGPYRLDGLAIGQWKPTRIDEAL